MSGHTPGPWQVDPRYPIDVQTADGKQEVCTPFYEGSRGNVINPVTGVALYGEALANARLIAAAPELLGALVGMLEIYGVREQHIEREPFASSTEVECCNAARAAIAKAKGDA